MTVSVELSENEEQAITYWLTHSLGAGFSPIPGQTADEYVRSLINQRISYLTARFNAIPKQD